jgi:Protein of unknown function (DUF1598)
LHHFQLTIILEIEASDSIQIGIRARPRRIFSLECVAENLASSQNLRKMGVSNMSKRIGYAPKSLFLFALLATIVGSYAPSMRAAIIVPGQSFFGNQVGGIKVDAKGVVSKASVELRNDFVKAMKDTVKPVSDDLRKSTKMRMVSLKALNAALVEAQKSDMGQVPDDVRFMAGLQRIQFVFVYPEENDIVLAGPGEGWKVDENGSVVGETTGLPVLLLEDFLIAMQCVNNARDGQGISASIDPTEEGVQRYTSMTSGKRSEDITPEFISQLEEAYGLQNISLTGVPGDSHFARVMVAADYRMKQIAMKLESSPIKELPSYLDMIKKSSKTPQQPRFWLATDFDRIGKSEDGLAWEIRGQGVKAMTEDMVFQADGARAKTGKTNALAEKWCETMTKNYEALAKADPIFGQLRGLMDMCVVAALLEKEGMLASTGLQIPMILDSTSGIEVSHFAVPKHVPTQIGHVQSQSQGVILAASGGIQVDSWESLAEPVVVAELASVREKAKSYGLNTFWWN